MLYNYNEVLEKYKDDYNVKKAIENKELYKIEKGLYSDKPNVHYLAIIYKKYPSAVISGHSAYYYHNLTDVIPQKTVVCTNRNATRIVNSKIKQIRMKNELYNLGKITILYEGSVINIYDKERLLIDLARNKNKISYDLYKEIITNYRNIANSLNMRKIEEYLSYFVNDRKIFEIIQDEVF
ncbi:MAG: hypothetical protein IJE89_01440 [Bacilli bacterium]|nr:hypothetical protein [Bacilli bacterium]